MESILTFVLTVGLIGVAVYGFLLAACVLAIEVVKRWVDLGKKSGKQ